GENSRDGTDANRSWNCGAEGETNDLNINAVRARQQRNFLATLMLSIGVPMICGGDEIGRTQRGNNNAYCQDNEVSWFDWQHADEALLAFVARLIGFRREHAVFQRRRWFAGRALRGENVTVIDTNEPVPDLREQHQHRAGEAMEVEARSMVVLRRVD